jgi:hypothetical protein
LIRTLFHMKASQLHNHKSLLLLIPTLKHLRLGRYKSCHMKPCHCHASCNPIVSSTNTIVSQIVEVIPLMLLSCLNIILSSFESYSFFQQLNYQFCALVF